ncbi:vegetative incompatibility het-e-1 [Fusarium globosum]|uniref:Vegetative incompatibility het-e-1 n=1 Tax=Fusarium globosum TaxID=78864 RepID=A0A8H6CWL5_9HYPO|nr:vegetative incompatibility het-e-1 [Fusarium globosum]
MPTKPVRLYDKIDTGVQNVRADCSPKVAFIEVWQDIKADYEIMRKVVHQHLSCLLDENSIRATVASRTKTLESISKSIDRRDDSKPDGQKHQSPRQIFDDLHDLVGFRVVVDYPSGLERSYDLIEARFKMEKFNNFPSTRAVGQYWKPRFGAYETRNYLVRLASDCSIELAIYADILFEIQVTTMAESLYNKLAHPLFYKASQGPLSRKDEMIIDMGRLRTWMLCLTLQDQHQPSFQLPTVPEARFDSKDLEESPKCHEKTRREVRNKILQWVDGVEAETLFWLHAPAGVGKSTLARTLVDDLRSQRKLAAGYFFKRGDEVRNDTCRVIPTIASQLIKTIPQYMNCLRQSIGSCNVETIDKISLQDQFDTLVYKPLSSTQCHLSNMLIIIDALDECTRPKHIPLILKLFSRLSALSNCRLCVLLSSRETRPLINALKPFKDNNTCRDMALHEEFLISTRLEIGTVLKDGLAAIKANRVVTEDPWPSFQVFDRVLKYATNPSPLYVYTSTFLRHIDGRNPAKRLERWLKSSRKSVSQLDHVYDPIINSVLAGEGDDDIPEPLEEDEILDLQLILGSLTLLAKPLQARSLQTLLSMDGDRFNTTLEALHAVVRATDDGHPLELIHKSFADYVLGLENTSLGSFSIDTSQIHRVLSERCIDRMQQGLCKNICHVDNPLIMSQDFDKNMVTKFIPPDLAYACVYWVYHIERSQNAFDLVNPFLEKHLLHWFEALSILGQRSLVEGGAAIRSLLTRGKRYPCTDNSNDSAIVKDAELFLKHSATQRVE